LRRSEAAALTWGDVEFRDDGAALLHLRRSKTDQEAKGVVLYVGREAAQALLASRPAPELLDPGESVSGMTTRNIGSGSRPPRRHDPGPGEERRGATSPNDRGTVEELQDAGPVHRAPGGGPGRGGQVLSGDRQ